jgi:hypothetical protein
MLPPGDEVGEEAWKIASDEGKLQLAITRDDAVQMGINPETLYKYPSEMGLGEEKYLARLDIFHQLHCLNMLRKAASPEIFGKGYHGLNIGETHLTWEEHIRHCQYGLFQMLTCRPDWGVLGFFAVEGASGPRLDFSIQRKCVNWAGLLKWKDENAIELTTEEWERVARDRPKEQLAAEGRTRPFEQGR